MQIKWVSQKGKQRKFNNDAVAILYMGGFLVVVIADAAEKNINRQVNCGSNAHEKRLACYWVESCITAISDDKVTLTDKNKLFEILAGLQKKLKFYYLHDIACYGVLIVDCNKNIADWYYVGDCLLGREDESGHLNWLHRPHRISELLEEPLEPSDKYILTKSLNARRFTYPDHLALGKIDKGSGLVLATDGYWCEYLQDSTAIEDLEDDCSVLKIKYGNKLLISKTDTENIFCLSSLQ